MPRQIAASMVVEVTSLGAVGSATDVVAQPLSEGPRVAGLPACLGSHEQACPRSPAVARRTGPATTKHCADAALCWSGWTGRRSGLRLRAVARVDHRPSPSEEGWTTIRGIVVPTNAIQFCLSIEVLFGLALRQVIGMVASLLKMAGLEDWPVQDTSTPCQRQKTVTIQVPFRRSTGNISRGKGRTRPQLELRNNASLLQALRPSTFGTTDRYRSPSELSMLHHSLSDVNAISLPMVHI